jgi:HEAT repeat protein
MEHEEALSEGGVEEAANRGDIPYLLEALGDPSFKIRVLAAGMLGSLGGTGAVPALITTASDRRGERPEVRIAALEALGELLDAEEHARLLEEFICEDNTKVVRASRRMLLGVDPEGYPRRLLASGCMDHRAIRVYGKRGLVEAIEPISRLLQSSAEDNSLLETWRWGRVYTAIRALGNIGGEQAVKTLMSVRSLLETGNGRGGGGLHGRRYTKIAEALEEAIERAGEGPAPRTEEDYLY